MCSVFGIASGWWSVSGLIADFVGVAFLGFDLIRVQSMLRASTAAELNHFNAMAENYGGVESWVEEIKKSTRWIREHEYSNHTAQDEISYNAQNAIERLKELSECVGAVESHLADIVSLTKAKVEGDGIAANASLRWSYLGLVFILIGFFGQLVGSWPCA